MNWQKAEDHLKDIRKRYTEIGVSGLPALYITLNPLLIRFENDERTEELHDAIMKLE